MRAPSGVELGEALDDDAGRQRGDERVESAARDQQAVERNR